MVSLWKKGVALSARCLQRCLAAKGGRSKMAKKKQTKKAAPASKQVAVGTTSKKCKGVKFSAERVIALYKKGKNVSQIAQACGYPPNTGHNRGCSRRGAEAGGLAGHYWSRAAGCAYGIDSGVRKPVCGNERPRVAALLLSARPRRTRFPHLGIRKSPISRICLMHS